MRKGNLRARLCLIYVLIHFCFCCLMCSSYFFSVSSSYYHYSSSSSSSPPFASSSFYHLSLLPCTNFLFFQFAYFLFLLLFFLFTSCLFLGRIVLLLLQFISSLLCLVPHLLCPLLTSLLVSSLSFLWRLLLVFLSIFVLVIMCSSNMPPPKDTKTLFGFTEETGLDSGPCPETALYVKI